jgi:hypothetical protein
LWAPAFIPVIAPDAILLDCIFPDFIFESAAPGPTLPSLDPSLIALQQGR